MTLHDPNPRPAARTKERRSTVDTPRTTLLSRVAEHLYWAGRYLERAEATARMVRTHTELFVDLPRTAGLGWAPLLAVTGSQEAYSDGHDQATEDEVVRFLLCSSDHPGSVVSSIALARENLRVTRDLIPRRSWEVVNETHLWLRRTADTGANRSARVLWTEELIRRCHMLQGSVVTTMSRDEAFAMFEIGRLVERADMTTRVIDVQAGVLMGSTDEALAPFIGLTWMAMLRSLGGEQMYRRKMGADIWATGAVTFLLRDNAFPRSVEHCLIDISRWLLELPDHSEAMAASAELQRQLDAADLGEFDVAELHEFLDRIQLALADLHGQVDRAYFTAPNLTPA